MPGYYKQGIGCADRGMKAIEKKVAGMFMNVHIRVAAADHELRNQAPFSGSVP